MTAVITDPPPVRVPVRVERLTAIGDDLAEEFRDVYQAAFAPLATRSAARQSLTDEEFLDEMRDARVTKLVAFDDTGEAGAMAIVATDLTLVPWISVPYYASRFPEEFARGAIYYVNAVVVRPERQGGPWARAVLEELYRYVAEHHAVMAFDCCGYNVDVVKLVDATMRSAHRIAHVETFELDQQRYYAFDMTGGLR
jgi:GNAT superfamily N-acetyltransferase